MQYALRLAYLGTRYAGWQRQRNAPSVQAELERALAEHITAPVRVVGAGRTDRGVHAEGQVAVFRADRELAVGGLVHGVNRLLPQDIRVLAAAPVPEAFHPRKCAVAKTYVYRFSRRRPPLPQLAATHLALEPELDLEAMSQAALTLIGDHDFRAFALAGHAPGGTRRRIFAARFDFEASEGAFRITGAGFLRGMVRVLLGTLLEIGRGQRSLADFCDLFAGGRVGTAAGPTAPAHGLTLESVDYPAGLQPVW